MRALSLAPAPDEPAYVWSPLRPAEKGPDGRPRLDLVGTVRAGWRPCRLAQFRYTILHDFERGSLRSPRLASLAATTPAALSMIAWATASVTTSASVTLLHRCRGGTGHRSLHRRPLLTEGTGFLRGPD